MDEDTLLAGRIQGMAFVHVVEMHVEFRHPAHGNPGLFFRAALFRKRFRKGRNFVFRRGRFPFRAFFGRPGVFRRHVIIEHGHLKAVLVGHGSPVRISGIVRIRGAAVFPAPAGGVLQAAPHDALAASGFPVSALLLSGCIVRRFAVICSGFLLSGSL